MTIQMPQIFIYHGDTEAQRKDSRNTYGVLSCDTNSFAGTFVLSHNFNMDMAPEMIPPYAPLPPSRRRRWPLILACILLAIAMLRLSYVIPVQTKLLEIDTITGSYRTQKAWLGCIRTRPYITDSHLSLRLQKENIHWSPNWQFVVLQENGAYWESRACGRSKPIMNFSTCEELFAQTASTSKVQYFVNMMQTGTEIEQSRMIQETIDQYLKKP